MQTNVQPMPWIAYDHKAKAKPEATVYIYPELNVQIDDGQMSKSHFTRMHQSKWCTHQIFAWSMTFTRQNECCTKLSSHWLLISHTYSIRNAYALYSIMRQQQHQQQQQNSSIQECKWRQAKALQQKIAQISKDVGHWNNEMHMNVNGKHCTTENGWNQYKKTQNNHLTHVCTSTYRGIDQQHQQKYQSCMFHESRTQNND